MKSDVTRSWWPPVNLGRRGARSHSARAFGGRWAKMIYLTEDIIEQSSGLLRMTLPEVGGSYELTCSPFLVQATGDCCGVAFSFWAKHGEWEFQVKNEQGHAFPSGDPRRFVVRKHYDENKPGALGLEWAARILRSCLSEWWSGTTPIDA